MEFKEKVNNWLIKNINNTKIKSNNDILYNNSYSNKVKHWLSTNENVDNKQQQQQQSMSIDNFDNNKMLPISTNVDDIDSLHSVDTAKYILSNNKKTKTRITRMTIKKYCHMSSVKSKKSIINQTQSSNSDEIKIINRSTVHIPCSNKELNRNFMQQNKTIISKSSTDSSDDGNNKNLKFYSERQQKRTKRISHRKQFFDQRTKFLSIVSELRKRSNSDDDNDDEPADGVNVLIDDYPKRLRKFNFIGRKSKNYDGIRKLLKCTEIRRRNNNNL